MGIKLTQGSTVGTPRDDAYTIRGREDYVRERDRTWATPISQPVVSCTPTGADSAKVKHETMKLAYVTGPYRADCLSGVVQNIRHAEAVALELWRIGYAVICPHMNTALFDGAAPDEVFLTGYLVILRRCDLLVLTPGWAKSAGCQGEREEACERSIPVYRWPEEYAELRKNA